MIPRFRPTIGLAELTAAFGPAGNDAVASFEAAFAAHMGQRHAVAFPHGRTGLCFLLRVLGLRDREIICPAYTCVVVAHAVVHSGNRPVFVDASLRDCNMDLRLARQAISPRTGAIVATSLFGHPVDLDALDALRADYPDIPIIQDCAHSFDARWRGRPVQVEGVAAIYGLNVSKLMTSIFGGMVTTDDDRLAAELRRLREVAMIRGGAALRWRRRIYLLASAIAFTAPAYGLVNLLERSGVLDRFVRYYDPCLIDMPADWLTRMSLVEASVGRVQLDALPGIIEARRAYARYYRQVLSGVPGLSFPDLPDIDGATFSHVVASTPGKRALIASAQRHGIQLGEVVEYSVPGLGAYAGPQDANALFPNAAYLADHTVNLPVSGRFDMARARKVTLTLGQALADRCAPTLRADPAGPRSIG